MRKIEIVIKDLSPLWLKIIAVLIFLATAYKIVTLTFFEVSPLVYLIMNTIALAIWTGKELVVIDYQNQEIGEGFRILGFTHMDKSRFTGSEKVFVNSVNSAQTFRHLAGTVDIHHKNYKAFLKTLEGNKICIGFDSDKEELLKKMKKCNQYLQTDIFDNTSGESVRV